MCKWCITHKINDTIKKEKGFKIMKTYRIVLEGTVWGDCYIEANTLAEAIEKSEDHAIDIKGYPTDWHVIKDECERSGEQNE